MSIFLANCGRKDSRIRVTAHSIICPQILLSDDTILAWNIPDKGNTAVVHHIAHGNTRRVGSMRLPDVIYAPLDRHRVLYLVQNDARSKYALQTCIYDMSSNSSRLLVEGATTQRIQRPASISGDKILVNLRKPVSSLAVVDVKTGKVRILLKGLFPNDAVWVRNTSAVLCGCSEPIGSRLEYVYRVNADGTKPTILWSRPWKGISGLRCSPDGVHIAYKWQGKLICESLRLKRKWKVIDLARMPIANTVNGTSLAWSFDGRYFAALVESNSKAELLMFDSTLNRSNVVKLGIRTNNVYPLGWLSDNTAFVLGVLDEESNQAQVWEISHGIYGIEAEELK